MPYHLFVNYFPEIAKKETRTVTLTESYIGLPAGDYTYYEMFCNEPGCDCRRVFLFVICKAIQEDPIAIIAYGWESREFYVNWFGKDDLKEMELLMGPCLNEVDRQSKYANSLLEIFKNSLIPDTEYINRIKRHYYKFRSIIDVREVKNFSKYLHGKTLH